MQLDPGSRGAEAAGASTPLSLLPSDTSGDDRVLMSLYLTICSLLFGLTRVYSRV